MPKILGINISPLSPEEIFNQLNSWLLQDKSRFLVTPNPEIILQAHKDEELFYILNQADLALADGFGLKLASYLDGEKIHRLTGADLVLKLLKLAQDKNLPLAILNWRGGLSKKDDLKRALDKKYPGLNYLVLDASRTQVAVTDLAQIANFSPAIVFCTFGSPYQEKTIYHNLAKWPSVRLAIGCGGAFDFLTGQLRRAPRVWQNIGLEWLWRLVKQPSRYKRIFNAVVVFSAKVLASKFIHRYRYRLNVCCLLYRVGEQGKEVLIVEREDEANHWQLPQGGTDGEDVVTAGRRELREETGVTSIIVRGVFKNLHCYYFGDRFNKKTGYKGQKQSLFIAEFTGQEDEIKINFWDHQAWKWVPANQLVESVHPYRRQSAQIYLTKLESLA
jgi:N-acetylglucosaminyldiphosphoundecaprenol N-acetyl-beta-D-mannosaminyltransferase